MTGMPGIVLFSGWSAGAGAWNAILAEFPNLPYAHIDWWQALPHPGAALCEAAAEANRQAGRAPHAAVIVIGWSLGGQLALQAALDRPDLVSDILLLATPARLLADETGEGADPVALRAMRHGLRRDATTIVRNFWAEALSGDRTGFDFDDHAAGILADVDAKTLDAGLAALANTDLRPLLPRIATPTFIMQGDEDRIVGAHAAQHLNDGLPNATVLAIAGGSHGLPLTHPRMVAEVLRALLAAHGGDEHP